MLWLLSIFVELADVLVPLLLTASAPEALVARRIEVSEVVALTARVAQLGALTCGGSRVWALTAYAGAAIGGEVPDLSKVVVVVRAVILTAEVLNCI